MSVRVQSPPATFGGTVFAADPKFGLLAATTSAERRIALRAAFAAADAIVAVSGSRGAKVVLPAGAFFVDDEIIYGDGVSIEAAGPGGTALWADHDFGPGKALLRPANSRNNFHRSIRGLWLRGKPTPSVIGAAPGTVNGPWAMDGLVVPSSTPVYDVVVDGGFRGGMHATNDHWQMFGCISQGSYYNLYIGYDYNAEADQNCFGCDFTSALRASIGVAGSNVMGGMTLEGVHLGYSPYAIWKESQGKWANFPTFPGEPTPGSGGSAGGNGLGVSGCKFIDVAFESCANAFFGSEDMAMTINYRGTWVSTNVYALNDVVVLNGVNYIALQGIAASTGPTPGTEGTQPAFWAIFGTTVSGNTWDGCDVAGNLGGGGSAIATEASGIGFACTAFTQNDLRNSFAQAVPTLLVKLGPAVLSLVANRIFVPDAEQYAAMVPSIKMDDRKTGGWTIVDFTGRVVQIHHVESSSPAIAKGDIIMRWTGGGEVKPFSDLAQAELGVALEAAVATGSVWTMKRGFCSRINVLGSLSPFGPFFTGSTTAGKANTSASRSGIARNISGDNGGWFVGEVL